jgi:hypothetical protein
MSGGPLPVRRAEASKEESERYELAEPHFEGAVRLAGEVATLADGELARVKFSSPLTVTIFDEVRGTVERWVRTFGG